jgi:hypothetical protein
MFAGGQLGQVRLWRTKGTNFLTSAFLYLLQLISLVCKLEEEGDCGRDKDDAPVR